MNSYQHVQLDYGYTAEEWEMLDNGTINHWFNRHNVLIVQCFQEPRDPNLLWKDIIYALNKSM